VSQRLCVFLLSLVFILTSCNQSHNDLESQAGSWQFLSPAVVNIGIPRSLIPSMALNSSGNPGIAYYNLGSPYSPPSFAYYDGTAWVGVNNLDYKNYSANNWIRGIDIAFDNQNRPVVAFTKWVAGVGGFVYVKRWSATTGNWKEYDVISLDHPNAIKLKLANNLPVIAYTRVHNGSSTLEVKRLSCITCTNWVSYGEPESGITSFSLALDKSKNPVLAYSKFGAGMIVKKWDSIQGQWVFLANPLTVISYAPAMDTDTNGHPVVVWQESNFIYAKRWNGNSWQSIGGAVTDNAIGTSSYIPALTLDNEGNPYVLWQGTGNALYVKHWKAAENRWRFVGPNPISNVSGYKVGNIPTIAWRNNSLVVTWRRERFYDYIADVYYQGGIFTKRYVP
jgi:hypothetical protein